MINSFKIANYFLTDGKQVSKKIRLILFFCLFGLGLFILLSGSTIAAKPQSQLSLTSSLENSRKPITNEASGTTTLISISSEGFLGNSRSTTPAISDNGQFIAFRSEATNLIPNDTNNSWDVFVIHVQTREVTRISVASDGTQGNGNSTNPVISGNGRYISFESSANNLIQSDLNNKNDIFIHDLQTSQTKRISINSDGTEANEHSLGIPAISSDGRYIAFSSSASNLVNNDTNNEVDVFIHDQQLGQTALISVDSSGIIGNDSSQDPAISGNGRYISFASKAPNLVLNDSNAAWDIFVHDTVSAETVRVSISSDGTEGNNYSYHKSSISDDGQIVAFSSFASNLIPNDTNQHEDIFLHNLQTKGTSLISKGSGGGQGIANSYHPTISADGRYVSFQTNANNFVTNDINGTSSDVFINDTTTSQTKLISKSTDGYQGNKGSYNPVISRNGRYIVFSTHSKNFTTTAENNKEDIFLHDRLGSSFTLTGQITDINGNPLEGVLLSTPYVSSFSNASGYFTFTNFITNTYSIIPYKAGYSFSPEIQTINVPPSALNLDFIGAFDSNALPLKETTMISASSEGIQGTGIFDNEIYDAYPSLSNDGRFITFSSSADNLVTNDTNNENDIFLHDSQLHSTIRISESSDNIEANRYSTHPSISADGRYITFASTANNLVQNDPYSDWDILLHDTQTKQTSLVSINVDSQEIGDAHAPVISGDGQWIVFQSAKANYLTFNIFLHNNQTNQITTISVDENGDEGNNSSRYPAISHNGRFIAFGSEADNLVTGDTNTVEDIFIHDTQLAKTRRISISSTGTQSNGSSEKPTISADGRYIAFASMANNLVPNDTNGWADIFLHDTQTGETTRISKEADGSQTKGGIVHDPKISADGRYITFSTFAHIVPGGLHKEQNIYLYDVQNDTISFISISSDGIQGNNTSYFPSISGNGRRIAFYSQADNLVPNDLNSAYDVFVYDSWLVYSIAGQVTDTSGNPVQGVTLQSSSAESAMTDISGNYLLPDSVAGTYTITPKKAGSSFNPSSIIVTVPPEVASINFTIHANLYLPIIHYK